MSQFFYEQKKNNLILPKNDIITNIGYFSSSRGQYSEISLFHCKLFVILNEIIEIESLDFFFTIS